MKMMSVVMMMVVMVMMMVIMVLAMVMMMMVMVVTMVVSLTNIFWGKWTFRIVPLTATHVAQDHQGAQGHVDPAETLVEPQYRAVVPGLCAFCEIVL